MNGERTLRPDFWVVVFDETKYWHLGKYADRIVKVECVYYEQTYLCEITPSYTLYPVGSRPTFADSVDMDDDKLVQDLDEYIYDGDAGCLEIEYRHCHNLDAALSSLPHKQMGDVFPETSLDEYAEMIEGMREYLQGNEVV